LPTGIIRLYYRIESHRFWKMETAPATLVDMGAFGMAANRSVIESLLVRVFIPFSKLMVSVRRPHGGNTNKR
jgi:hypothetical protein